MSNQTNTNERLYKKLEGIKSDYRKLRNDYTSLEIKYNNLQENYEHLEKIFYVMKNKYEKR